MRGLRGRFLVIQCPQSFQRGERIDFHRVAAERDRIWKAAVLAYRNGEEAFLKPEDLAASNRNLMALNMSMWLGPISRWLDQPINANGPPVMKSSSGQVFAQQTDSRDRTKLNCPE